MTRKFFGTDGIRGRANNPTLALTVLAFALQRKNKYGLTHGSLRPKFPSGRLGAPGRSDI